MLSEEKRIKTKAQLKEYLDVETELYQLRGLRQHLAYLFQASERSVLRKHIILLRKTEYYENSGHKLLGRLYHARLMKFQLKTGIHVPINSIGKGLRVMHVEPCGFTGGVTVGENCRLHSVSFVMGDGSGEVATIGDNVIIGMGAMIIGGVTIADNISIGAGAVVTKSFLEPGITIAGVPARKLNDTRKIY